MHSLLLHRRTGVLSPLDYATSVTESLFLALRPQPGRFPDACHHHAAVNSLALDSVDHRFLLSGGADTSIKIWDLREGDGGGEVGEESIEGKENSAEGKEGKAEEKEETAEGDLDQAGDKGREEPEAPQTPQSPPRPAARSPVVSIAKRSAHQFGVSTVKWWPHDTGMFVLALFDHSVKAWDTNAVEMVHAFDLGARVYAVDVAAHVANTYAAPALIAAASDQPAVRLLDLRLAASAHTLPGHKGKTLAVAWHPTRASVLALGGHDGEAKVWDIRMSRSCLARLDMAKTNVRPAAVDALNLTLAVRAHLGPVNAVVWDELGATLYTAGNDDKIRVWDMAASAAPPINKLVNFGPLTRNKYLQTLPLVLTPRAEAEVQHVLFALDSGDVLVFRALDGKLVSRLLRPGSKHSVRTASLVYGAPFLVTCYGGTMDGEIVEWQGLRAPRSHVYEAAPHEAASAVSSREGLYDDPYFKFGLT